MLTKLWNAVQGYKTYVLAGCGIALSVTGHFWGPFQIASVTVPAFSWDEVWKIVWNSGLFAALRHGMEKKSA